jgi:hypothetical protein
VYRRKLLHKHSVLQDRHTSLLGKQSLLHKVCCCHTRQVGQDRRKQGVLQQRKEKGKNEGCSCGVDKT